VDYGQVGQSLLAVAWRVPGDSEGDGADRLCIEPVNEQDRRAEEECDLALADRLRFDKGRQLYSGPAARADAVRAPAVFAIPFRRARLVRFQPFQRPSRWSILTVAPMMRQPRRIPAIDLLALTSHYTSRPHRDAAQSRFNKIRRVQ